MDDLFGRNQNKKSKAETIEELRLRYVGMCEIIAHTQAAFSHYLASTICVAGLNLTVILYTLLTHTIRAIEIGHAKLFIVVAATTGLFLIRICALCVVASGPELQVID